MPLTDDFIEVADQGRGEYVHDIDIYRCESCGFTQNPSDFNHERYYRDYGYSVGHSAFTRQFMGAYAREAFESFKRINGHDPRSVLEVGSGDGHQLSCFRQLGVNSLLGVEPSEQLAGLAAELGVKTEVGFFGLEMMDRLAEPVDICISSYTFDHVRSPLDYLRAAHQGLSEGGILALEVHDLAKIVDRNEYCLFEHEHTIYLTANDARRLLAMCGFDVIAVNPLPGSVTRGNSLIIIAKKAARFAVSAAEAASRHEADLINLQKRIDSTIDRIDRWCNSLQPSEPLVGFGAGGRGVMTLAALRQHGRFSALLDSNFQGASLLTPKTRIPVVGPDQWSAYSDAHCLVFSFGYFDEILKSLERVGFKPAKVVSLLDFYDQTAD
jgi:SAM-dependent methyltransferase